MNEINNFTLERSTIWSFPQRGSWATHEGDYRGNWSPYVPRNLILRYSKPMSWILDPFVGSGTTLIESKLLNRNAIGIDINQEALSIAKDRISFECKSNSKIILKKGDAGNLTFIKNESIDLICAHPPYADIIKYSSGLEDDMSLLSYENFLKAFQRVVDEAFRVLKPNGICTIMVGDIRKKGKLCPLGMNIMNLFLRRNFELKEIIIKEQHNCKSSRYWEHRENNFLLLAHEYIFVFNKII